MFENVLKILSADTNDLRELAEIAEANPKTIFIGADFRSIDITPDDLKGFQIHKASFARDTIFESTEIAVPENDAESDAISIHVEECINACKTGMTSKAKQILLYGIDKKLFKHKDLRKILYIAISYRRLEIVEQIFLHKGLKEIKESRSEGTLLIAVSNRHMKMVEVLLSEGADPNVYKSISNTSPLEIAVDNGDPEIVKILLSKGVNPNRYNLVRERSPLEIAVDNGNLKIVNMLLSEGADPNYYKSVSGESPLKIAVKNVDLQIVKALLSRGADPNHIGSFGGSLLRIAEKSNQYGSNHIMRELKLAGAR